MRKRGVGTVSECSSGSTTSFIVTTNDRFLALTVQLFSWEAHRLREFEHRDGKRIKTHTLISRLIFCEVR